MENYLLLFVLGGIITGLALNIYTLRKIWGLSKLIGNTNDMVHTGFRDLFRQLQLLDALKSDLKFAKSLPPTGGMAGGPDFLRRLADYIIREKPNVVVECGSGLSTVIISRCLQINGGGHLYSLDHEKTFADQTRSELERQGLSEWATVLHAPLTEYQLSGETYRWYETSRIPDEQMDIIVVDGPPASVGKRPRYPAGPLLFPRLANGGTILLDDATRPGEQAVIQAWCDQFKNLQFDTNDQDFKRGLCVGKAVTADNMDAPA